MAKFFPPSQLPPCEGQPNEPDSPPASRASPSRRRALACMLVAALLGGFAVLIGYLLESPVWFAGLPIALVFGWFVVKNPTGDAVPPSERGGTVNGPVFW